MATQFTFETDSTNNSVYLEALLNTTNQPASGLDWETASLVVRYQRLGEVAVTVPTGDLSGDDPHVDGGFVEMTSGLYRIDVPDAAFASGVAQVIVFATVSGAHFKQAIVCLEEPTAAPIVYPLSSSIPDRVSGTTLTAFTNETVSFSPAPVDANGDSVDTSAMDLTITIESQDETVLETIANGDITKTATNFTFETTSLSNAAKGPKRWACRQTTSKEVVSQGDYIVKHAAGG